MTHGDDPVIDPATIHGRSMIILDARRREDFIARHYPGAVILDIVAWESVAKGEGTTLANADLWLEMIGALGIDGTTPAAVYDDGRMTEAARAWFILQHFGVATAVIDGGWPALERIVGDLAEQGPASAQPVRFSPPRRAASPVALVTRQALKEDLGASRILDARTAAEYAGTDLRKNSRGGHLPGAVHLAHTDLLDATGRMKSPGALRALMEAAGFRPGDRIVTHCDGGGRAALAALAAVRAGFTDVGSYYLSFADWARDESCPIQR
jgi:thiosulfate/3-mercaptopyruvate sulfurtransferase